MNDDEERKKYRAEAIGAITSITVFVVWITFMLIMMQIQE